MLSLFVCLCVRDNWRSERPPRPENASGRRFHLLIEVAQVQGFCDWAISRRQSGEINESADCTAGNYRVQLVPLRQAQEVF